MKTITTLRFIKSYPDLLELSITKGEKEMIELILSFQLSGNEFFMPRKKIAQHLRIEIGTVKNIISRLVKIGYLRNTLTSNYNGEKGGSSSKLEVNILLIEKHMNEVPQLEIAMEKEVIQPQVIELPELDENEILSSDSAKTEIEFKNDGFANEELAKKMAESLLNKTEKQTPIIKETKKVKPMNDAAQYDNEFDFLNEQEEKVDFNEVKQTIENKEQKEINDDKYLSVQPKDKNISINEYFKLLKVKFPDTNKSLDELEQFLLEFFNITMFNDEQLNNIEMAKSLNDQVQTFVVNKHRYLKLF